MAERTVCRSCGAIELDDLGACAPFPRELLAEVPASRPQPGRLFRCRRCGLGQRQPCLDEESLVAMYREAPADSLNYEFEANGAWRAAREYLRAAFPSRGGIDVLDVGCHTGAFLAGMPPEWRRFGIEIATQARSQAARHGIQLIAERLESVNEQWRGRFDVVTLFDVVEHLPDPAQGLAMAASLLRPGGFMVVSTGDMDAWTWRWSPGGHWYLQSPQHLSFGSRAFFQFVARRAGLRMLRRVRIPHRVGSLRARMCDAVSAAYWLLRTRGGWCRIPQRVIQALPGFRALRHKEAMPWTMHVSDHQLVVFGR